MKATLLHQNDYYTPDNSSPDLTKYGEWVRSQDPLTKEIIRVWKPYEDMPDTPDIDESVTLGQIPCLARGMADGGYGEKFGDGQYENLEGVKLWVPASVRISKRDRVTNIKDAIGHTRWLDDDFVDPRKNDTIPKATVFNVNSIVPLFNPFNVLVEQFVILERAEVTSAF